MLIVTVMMIVTKVVMAIVTELAPWLTVPLALTQ